MHIALYCTLIALACEVGCQRHRARPAVLRASRTVYDTSPIDASAFGTQTATRRHILGMPAGELAVRLTAFKLLAHSRFSLGRGADVRTQDDLYALTQDNTGAFVLRLETPHSQLETQQIGENVFVRYDRGTLRKKTRRDMDSEALRDVAVAALPQALGLCQQIAYTNPQPDQVDGRPTTRFTLALGEPPAAAEPELWAAASALHLPMGPPPLWREQSHPTSVQGFVRIDTATGVLLRGQVDVSLQIVDRASSPTTLQVHADVQLSEVGRVAPLVSPTRYVSEFKRPLRAVDPLSFYRDVVPRPPPPGSAATPPS